VQLVVQGILLGQYANRVVKHAQKTIMENHSMDRMILGCTHYKLLKNVMQNVIDEHIAIISSSEETVRETSTILEVHQLATKNVSKPEHQFYTTGDLHMFAQIAKTLFNRSGIHIPDLTIHKAVID